MAGRHGQIRIIGGLLKRTPINVAQAVASMRPTPDRVRETLFNWLGRRVDGAHCLDLFAGSGALGLEAASRGAGSVLFVEKNGRAAKMLDERIGSLTAATDPAVRAIAARLRVTHGDALAALARSQQRGQRFDLLFLDPPFSEDWLGRLLPAVAPVLAEQALIYLESAAEITELTAAGGAGVAPLFAERIRHARAGQVHYHLFERQSSPSGS